MEVPERVLDRARTHWVLDPMSGCHISTYSVGSHGYAQIGWRQDGRCMMVLHHRARWIAERGPIPDDLTIDHNHSVCQNIRCCNPAHLRLLTRTANVVDELTRRWSVRTHYFNRHSRQWVPRPKKIPTF